jgi:uncharacterized BrkB/YihY/UPF0761 family membrane protein
MNPVERGLRLLDRGQQRFPPIGFVVGVVKKFGDDRGTNLAVLLAYYGFMALFPLLLLFTTVLGFIGNDQLEESVLGKTLAQFPVVGQQIGADAPQPLTGSIPALVIGILGLLYGSLGVAQAAQHAMAQVWNIPGVVRPGFLARLARSLLFFLVLGGGLVITTVLSGVATHGTTESQTRIITLVLGLVLNIAWFVMAFRVLTPDEVHTRQLVPGAVGAAVAFSVLLALGTALVQRTLRHAQPIYGQFAFVLGLIWWLFLLAQVTLYAAEFNVVRARRLWPRSILQPPLTEADERVLRDIARQEERRPEQRVGVGFAPDAADEAAADAALPRDRDADRDRVSPESEPGSPRS